MMNLADLEFPNEGRYTYGALEADLARVLAADNMDLYPQGAKVSCSGLDCPLADASDAERRQHEAEVAHWFPEAPCTVYEGPRPIEFLVSMYRRGDERDEQVVTVRALNGLLAMDTAQTQHPGWIATAALSTESAAL